MSHLPNARHRSRYSTTGTLIAYLYWTIIICAYAATLSTGLSNIWCIARIFNTIAFYTACLTGLLGLGIALFVLGVSAHATVKIHQEQKGKGAAK